MTTVDPQLPKETLELLLQHKKEVLENISRHYQSELDDATADGERLFKYGFTFAALVETAISGLSVALLETADPVLFAASLLFLTLGMAVVLYERLRMEKAVLRQHCNQEREPIMQQIAMLKGFLEPGA